MLPSHWIILPSWQEFRADRNEFRSDDLQLRIMAKCFEFPWTGNSQTSVYGIPSWEFCIVPSPICVDLLLVRDIGSDDGFHHPNRSSRTLGKWALSSCHCFCKKSAPALTKMVAERGSALQKFVDTMDCSSEMCYGFSTMRIALPWSRK